MTIEEFLTELQKLKIIGYSYDKKTNKFIKQKTLSPELFIKESWKSGGVSMMFDKASPGWADDEPDFFCLDTIVLHFLPNISLIDYRKILSLVQRETLETYGLYGDISCETIKYISLQDLYEVIVSIQSDVGDKTGI